MEFDTIIGAFLISAGIAIALGFPWALGASTDLRQLREDLRELQRSRSDHGKRLDAHESRMAKHDGRLAGHAASLVNLDRRLAALENWRAE